MTFHAEMFDIFMDSSCSAVFRQHFNLFRSKFWFFYGRKFDFWLFRSKYSVFKLKKLLKFWFQGQDIGFKVKLFQFFGVELIELFLTLSSGPVLLVRH